MNHFLSECSGFNKISKWHTRILDIREKRLAAILSNVSRLLLPAKSRVNRTSWNRGSRFESQPLRTSSLRTHKELMEAHKTHQSPLIVCTGSRVCGFLLRGPAASQHRSISLCPSSLSTVIDDGRLGWCFLKKRWLDGGQSVNQMGEFWNTSVRLLNGNTCHSFYIFIQIQIKCVNTCDKSR